VVEDIAKEEAFNEAIKSDPPFDYVLHTASPFHFNVQDPVKDLLDPAIKGTIGILKAIKAYAPSVKRVVITSSFAAIINPEAHAKVYSEADWNPITWEESLIAPGNAYRGSKTFAEKAAWDFVEQEKPNFTLATINPPLVLGPIVHYLNSLDAINTSNSRIRDFIQGKYKEVVPPTGTYIWVDVREVALAHVRAIEVEEAAGKRFFTLAGYMSNKAIAEAIRETHPGLESKLPPKDYPDDTPADIYGYDNTRTIQVLGLKYRTLTDSVSDTVNSLVDVGA